MPIDLAHTVVTLDLDDTLYPEADYVKSGIRHVCARIQALYGLDLYPQVTSTLLLDSKLDWMALICKKARLPSSAKESLRWMYRLHEPDIDLTAPSQELLEILRSAARALVVLTDGRSLTQRLKLKALGLSDIPAYISEEYGDEKPSSIRYQAIMKDIPARHYIYIADNPAKDFLAPNQLGWQTIGVSAGPQNIHSQKLDSLSEDYWPSVWVSKLSDFFLSQKC